MAALVALELVTAQGFGPTQGEITKHLCLLGMGRETLSVGFVKGSNDVGHLGPARAHELLSAIAFSRSVFGRLVHNPSGATLR